MKLLKICVLLTVLIGGLYSLVLGYQAPKSNLENKIELPIQAEAGRELYQQNCAKCHGGDGKGETEQGETYDVPNIADAKWQKRHSDKKIAAKIIKGGGGMPAYGKKLSKNEIDSLVVYVRSLKQ